MKLHTIFVALAAMALAGCSDKQSDPSPAAQLSAADPASAAQTAKETGEASSTPHAATNEASAGAAAVASAPKRPDSPYLSAEKNLLVDSALSTEKAASLLQSDKGFQQAIRQFDHSAANSPEAQDLVAHYKGAIARGLGDKGTLRDFSCGLSLCIGSMRTKSAEAYSAWSEGFAKDTGAPTYSFMEMTNKLGKDDYESRFVFSTDPGANSVRTPLKSGQ